MNAHDVYKFCCDELSAHGRLASKETIAAHFNTTSVSADQQLGTLWESGLLVQQTTMPAYAARQIGYSQAMRKHPPQTSDRRTQRRRGLR